MASLDEEWVLIRLAARRIATRASISTADAPLARAAVPGASGVPKTAMTSSSSRAAGSRPAHQLGEEGEAVGVGPLQIIDDEDHGPVRREPGEELAQRREDERAQLGGMDRAHVHRLPGLAEHTQHGEDLSQEPGVARDQL